MVLEHSFSGKSKENGVKTRGRKARDVRSRNFRKLCGITQTSGNCRNRMSLAKSIEQLEVRGSSRETTIIIVKVRRKHNEKEKLARRGGITASMSQMSMMESTVEGGSTPMKETENEG